MSPNVTCDTHSAIKCKCDASPATMAQKAADLAAKAAEEQVARDEAAAAAAAAGSSSAGAHDKARAQNAVCGRLSLSCLSG